MTIRFELLAFARANPGIPMGHKRVLVNDSYVRSTITMQGQVVCTHTYVTIVLTR